METLMENNVEENDNFERIKNKLSLDNNKLNIMLITNRDSDNVGDQVIEACGMQLIATIMKNLGVDKKKYKITSRAAGMVSKAYIKNPTPEEFKIIEDKVKEADIIVFGGAPIFNYAYQIFYKRTIITLELAQKYNIPVFFSSIGVEKYDENNIKCQELKEALHLPCVKMITTRDDLDSLIKYKEPISNIENGKEASFNIDIVADPAVFTDIIFSNFKGKAKNKPTIGCAVVRRYIFRDNDIKFSLEQQFDFWINTRRVLMEKGYNVQFFTTGHFSDEVFLDVMKRKYNLSDEECIFNMGVPEKLTKTISSYKGVIAYRLHANIVAYSLHIPAIGLTWNQKVPLFYESINYPERAFSVEDWKADTVVEALENAIDEGVKYKEEHAMALYNTLFNAFKGVLSKDEEIKAYTYDELIQEIEVFEGTSAAEKEHKEIRKLRRTYENYHALEQKINKLKKLTKFTNNNKFVRFLAKLFK